MTAPGHLLTCRIPVDGGVNVLFDALTVHGQRGWEVFLVTADGPNVTDGLRLLQTSVATFTFTS